MIRIDSVTRIFGLAILGLAMAAAPSMAKDQQSTGKVNVHVSPKQAYVFVDGNAIRDGSQTVALSPGKHTIAVYNYGFSPNVQTVNVVAGQTRTLHVGLQRSGQKVSGPFGDIELKGHPRAAVFLNGDTPDYFVGHVDEFDNNWMWHQWLLVKPGDYKVTVTREGRTIWSGPVDVKAGQREVVYLNHNGKIVTKNFKKGLTLGPQPRFDAGIASAMVPIAPVTAQLAVSQPQTSCGQSATLNWKSTDAVNTSITNLGNVASSGDKTVSPKKTTAYTLVAAGPGGVVRQTATIDVNSQPAATLSFNQPEVEYKKVGDKVVEQGSATLSWTTAKGDKVTIEPLGDVASSGTENIEAEPTQTSAGPINQDVAYKLHVTNACGGTATRTAMLHIVGSIEPPPPVTLASLFYPTNYPNRRHAMVGLVSSQKVILATAAKTFKNNEQYDAQNELMIVGHADVRGSDEYNMALSQRRLAIVEHYLISQGIPPNKIETQADGKDHELSEQQVQQLQAQDKQTPPKWMSQRQKATWLAYNRRVDIVLEPEGQRSAQAYPNDAPDARLLWQRPEPSLKSVEAASRMPRNSEVAQTQNSGN